MKEGTEEVWFECSEQHGVFVRQQIERSCSIWHGTRKCNFYCWLASETSSQRASCHSFIVVVVVVVGCISRPVIISWAASAIIGWRSICLFGVQISSSSSILLISWQALIAVVRPMLIGGPLPDNLRPISRTFEALRSLKLSALSQMQTESDWHYEPQTSNCRTANANIKPKLIRCQHWLAGWLRFALCWAPYFNGLVWLLVGDYLMKRDGSSWNENIIVQ